MDELVYCKKCHDLKTQKMNYENASKQIKDACDMEVVDSCISYCGYGREKHFVLFEDEIYEASDFDELVEKVKNIEV